MGSLPSRGVTEFIKVCSTVDRTQDLAAGSMLSSDPQSHWLPGTRRTARHLNTDMFKGGFSIGGSFCLIILINIVCLNFSTMNWYSCTIKNIKNL